MKSLIASFVSAICLIAFCVPVFADINDSYQQQLDALNNMRYELSDAFADKVSDTLDGTFSEEQIEDIVDAIPFDAMFSDDVDLNSLLSMDPASPLEYNFDSFSGEEIVEDDSVEPVVKSAGSSGSKFQNSTPKLKLMSPKVVSTNDSDDATFSDIADTGTGFLSRLGDLLLTPPYSYIVGLVVIAFIVILFKRLI